MAQLLPPSTAPHAPYLSPSLFIYFFSTISFILSFSPYPLPSLRPSVPRAWLSAGLGDPVADLAHGIQRSSVLAHGRSRATPSSLARPPCAMSSRRHSFPRRRASLYAPRHTTPPCARPRGKSDHAHGRPHGGKREPGEATFSGFV